MKKKDWNYLISALMFVAASTTVVLGLLLAFVIPFGRVSYSEKLFLGVHRHDWATFHETLALSFILLLILHIWLHWQWIVQTTRNYFSGESKTVLGALASCWLIILIAGWLVLRF